MLKDELISQREATEKSWNRFLANREKEWSLHGHDTGIHDLNLMIGGWIPTKVTTIGARSGIGKTAITVPMIDAGARVLADRRAEFLFCSWEMESSFIVDRHICYETGINLRLLNQGARLLGEQKMKEVKAAYKTASKLPVAYQQNSTDIRTVKAMCMQHAKICQEKSAIEGIYVQPVVVIDYIGMAMFEGSGLRTYGIGDFMNGMKQVANDTGISVLILAQIGRAADTKEVPDRTDFADSQSIENASDNLILLHRPEYNNVKTILDPSTGTEIDSTKKMLVRVLKGRDYGTGDALINCDIKHFRFWNMEHEFGYKYWDLYSNEDFWLDHFGLKDHKPVNLAVESARLS